MRTRNQSRRSQQSNGEEEDKMERSRNADKCDDSDTLTNISKDAVSRLIKRTKSRGSRGPSNGDDDSYLQKCDPESGSSSMPDGERRKKVKKDDKEVNREAIEATPSNSGTRDEIDELEWEEGLIPIPNSVNSSQEHTINGVTVEFDISPDSAKRKQIRRATTEEKELAELVHKVNLLCLLGRGRSFDMACDDHLIQASLLSLLPANLLKIAEVPKLTAKALTPLVDWFHKNFHVRGPDDTKKLPSFALASALEAHQGTAEEVAALSVALFRALNVTTRFVAVLDVTSLKPDVDKPESSSQITGKVGSGIFGSSTLMVPGSGRASLSPSRNHPFDKKDGDSRASVCSENRVKASKLLKDNATYKESSVIHKSNGRVQDPSTSEHQDSVTEGGVTKRSGEPKRKGDLQFEMQLEMALSSSSIESSKRDGKSNLGNVDNTPLRSFLFKKLKAGKTEESPVSASGMSTALGSRKVGAPLYWAEVYCTGENSTGKWVHIDAVNAIIDGEQKVEAAAAACKKSLRYVAVFAGLGAKDVTRRYCTKWYKIASERVNSIWWDSVLAPLKELERQATGGIVQLEEMDQRSASNSFAATRSSVEDMELETRALTEPLPSNQQAYKTHPLYAMERWLNKYEILYPKGPVLGVCSGHPVYPRTCVQTLHTKQRWLREGRQVKADELPAKILKRSLKRKVETPEDDEYAEGIQVSLYGKWQTETLCLPRAVDGIVPRNERGQVDVWSEKCLPPGTVHLRLPRVAFVAKRLEIDFAPAMVGFESRNGRSVPVFEGIVVCTEFKDAILEAYDEEEQRIEAEDRKRNEAQALSRWYQLLSSIVTRQRLKNCYGGDENPSQDSAGISKREDTRSKPAARSSLDDKRSLRSKPEKLQEKKQHVPQFVPTENHEHVFLLDEETSDGLRTKRCQCGFSIQFEEL